MTHKLAWACNWAVHRSPPGMHPAARAAVGARHPVQLFCGRCGNRCAQARSWHHDCSSFRPRLRREASVCRRRGRHVRGRVGQSAEAVRHTVVASCVACVCVCVCVCARACVCVFACVCVSGEGGSHDCTQQTVVDQSAAGLYGRRARCPRPRVLCLDNQGDAHSRVLPARGID